MRTAGASRAGRKRARGTATDRAATAVVPSKTGEAMQLTPSAASCVTLVGQAGHLDLFDGGAQPGRVRDRVGSQPGQWLRHTSSVSSSPENAVRVDPLGGTVDG